jgi:serine/threonine protein kinase
LGTTLKAFGKLNEKLVAGYAAKIIEGLDYLHKQDVSVILHLVLQSPANDCIFRLSTVI